MALELINLKSDQHQLTFVPKISSDLPFFNLTYKRKEVPTVIKYQGADTDGRPMRWEVYQDTSKEIGPPGVEAHQVWYLLIKPAIDATRNANGVPAEVIPLGGVRECLRKVCWSAGGRQARELIKAITQISFAGCIADLWLPSGRTDEQGKKSYYQVKGRFSRLSVYAIGEHHLTEDELKSTSFDFDLNDVLYIKLDPLEVKLQQIQDQRPNDNQYMFSVAPIGRRWYELMAGKIYGVIKNAGEYCEIRYSWYSKHDHTLKRYYERRRVVQQMNQVVRDHLASGYIKKVTYRAVTEADKELDFIIRYYVGEGARDSTKRITTLLQKKKPKPQFVDSPPSARSEKTTAQPITAQPVANEEYLSGMMSRGVGEKKAHKVLSKIAPDQPVQDQLEWYDHQIASAPQGKLTNPPGLLVSMIEENINVPDWFETSRKRTGRLRVAAEIETRGIEANRRELAYEEYRREALDRYITESLPTDDRAQLAEAKRQELMKHSYAAHWSEEQISGYIRAAMRSAATGKVKLLSFEEFFTRTTAPSTQPTEGGEAAINHERLKDEATRALALLPEGIVLELLQQWQERHKQE